MTSPDTHGALPAGVYLASRPATPGAEPGRALDSLQDEVVTNRLHQALEAVAETVSRIRERHAHDDDPAPAARMQAVCARSDAPLVLRSLLRRVEVGHVTWGQVWRSPAEHDGGMALLTALVRDIGRE